MNMLQEISHALWLLLALALPGIIISVLALG